jgi:hypothetical protein
MLCACATLAATLGLTGLAIGGQIGGPDVTPTLVYRAHADVDGDGRSDTVLLKASATGGSLQVKLATGALISVKTASDAPFLPGLVAVGNVNGLPGVELFVDEEHITTDEVIAVYTFSGGRLIKAGALPAYGSDFGIRFGMSCRAAAGKHHIEDDLYQLIGSGLGRHWTLQRTSYEWRGARLRQIARHPTHSISTGPSRSQVGVHCGRTF